MCAFVIVIEEQFFERVVVPLVTGSTTLGKAFIVKNMPMKEKKMLGDPGGVNPKRAEILKNERLAAMVSAYLDGELEGRDLEEFESLLKSDSAFAREVQDMRNIELRLMEMGADILSEPLPEAMLEALSKIGSN